MTGTNPNGNTERIADDKWLGAIRSLYREQVAAAYRHVEDGELSNEVAAIMRDSWQDICSQAIARRFAVPTLTGFELLTGKAV